MFGTESRMSFVPFVVLLHFLVARAIHPGRGIAAVPGPDDLPAIIKLNKASLTAIIITRSHTQYMYIKMLTTKRKVIHVSCGGCTAYITTEVLSQYSYSA